MPTLFALSTAAGLSVARSLGRLARALGNRRRANILAQFDDRMLADIGITRSDLRDAYAAPLWRDPTDVLAHRAGERRGRRRKLEIPPSPFAREERGLRCAPEHPARC